MENPFVFGKAVEGAYFTDRQEYTARLEANLTHGINTILISPRRWGKTSLVKKVIGSINQSDSKVVFLDVFQCKSEYDFYKEFATAVIKQTATKFEEWVETAKSLLTNISPKFSFGSDPLNDFSVSFEWNAQNNTEDTILSLPEKIAERKKIKIIICLDEFQQIADFTDSITFQKKLRSVWQHQQHVTYCMFGSKKHLLQTIFNDKGMPFFKFGDMMFLSKISTDEWIPYICGKFECTGKYISPVLACKICELTDNVSSYVQHLSWIVWYRSGETTTENDVDAAVNDLLEQNKAFFQRDVEQLSAFQLNFLMAMADNITSGFSTKEILNKYNLGSSANVQSIKKALVKKDLISVDGETVTFEDSLFKLWLKRM